MHDFTPEARTVDRPPEDHPRLMIGKVASLYDITVQTLRHYDKIGLFQPELVNPETGYRYYSVIQLRQLEYILFLRQLNFSLPEIQKVMGEYRAGGSFSDTLVERRAALDRQIGELKSLQERIDVLLHIPGKQSAPENTVSIQRFEPPRMFLYRPIKPLPVAHPDFSRKLMEHRKALLGKLPPIQTQYSFSAGVSLSDFRKTGVLRYTGIFLDPGLYGSMPPPGAMELPEGFYATIRFNRNSTRPEDAYKKLSDFLKAHNFRSDDTVVECAMDPSFASISRLSEETELQVRIYMDESP